MAAKKKVVKKKVGSARKGRAAKPTKEETVEVATGEAAPLLAGNMPPKKDLLYHLNQIKGYQDAAKTAAGRVTAAKKSAKEAGVDMQAVALALGFKRSDPLDIATMLKQLQVFMREDGTPVQLSLYEPKFGSVEEQAKSEGWRDGKAARTPDTTRWPEGSPGHVEYMRRWNDAQKDNLEGGSKEEED
jgi:hypothetical protein